MKMRIGVVLAAAFCALLSNDGWCDGAGSVTTPPMPIRMSIGQSMSHGMLSFPLVAGQLQTRLSPGFATMDKSSLNMEGWAMTGSAAYGLTEHWGAGLLIGHTRLSGHSPVNVRSSLVYGQLANKTDDRRAISSEGDGTVVLANLICDPWSGNGFRMPIYMGLGYMDLNEKREDTVLGLRNTGKVSTLAPSLGISPSLGFKNFRAGGFVMFLYGLDAGHETLTSYQANGVIDAQYSTDGLGDADALIAVIGTEITYTPWGLSLGWIPPIDGTSTYGLAWTRRWGGTGGSTSL